MNDFYESHYGEKTTDGRMYCLVSLIRRYVQLYPHVSLRLLDVGCGNGVTFAGVVQALQSEKFPARLSVTGWDISKAGVEEAKKSGMNAEVKNITDNVVNDQNKSAYNLIVFSEVLEHLVLK